MSGKCCHSHGTLCLHTAGMQITTGIRRSQSEPVSAPFRRVQILHTKERLEKLDLTSSSSALGAEMKAEEEQVKEMTRPLLGLQNYAKVGLFLDDSHRPSKHNVDPPCLLHSGAGEFSGSARRGTAAEEEVALPELDLQCVASSAEEREATGVQVQNYEGAPDIQGKASSYPPIRPNSVCW